MNKSFFAVTAVLVATGVAFSALAKTLKIDPLKHMPRSVLRDKIKGGWVGKVIGVSYGGLVPPNASGKISGSAPVWKAEQVGDALKQHDLLVQGTFLTVLDNSGLDAPCYQFGEALRTTDYELHHANAAARRNLNREMIAPWSGNPLYSAHTDDDDFQSEADFIGLMCPNLPSVADIDCVRAGRVMNYGDGVIGGMWVCGMYSAAYFSDDTQQIVQAGLDRIPASNKYAKVIGDVIAWHNEDPANWTNCWQKLESKWGKINPCPDGAMSTLNVDAKLNGGLIAMALLYGKADFSRTLEIAARAGHDAQSNAGTAAGILGVVLGYDKIPDQWKSSVPKVMDSKFADSGYTLSRAIDATEKRALTLIVRAGGKMTDQEVIIPSLKGIAGFKKSEEFAGFGGIPDKHIGFSDTAWAWKGEWVADKEGKSSEISQSEAVLKFDGIGVVLTGLLDPQGGRADVYLDDGPSHILTLDAYTDKNTHDDVLWHAFGLSNGAHTLRIVPRGAADPRSSGKRVYLTGAVVYRAP